MNATAIPNFKLNSIEAVKYIRSCLQAPKVTALQKKFSYLHFPAKMIVLERLGYNNRFNPTKREYLEDSDYQDIFNYIDSNNLEDQFRAVLNSSDIEDGLFIPIENDKY